MKLNDAVFCARLSIVFFESSTVDRVVDLRLVFDYLLPSLHYELNELTSMIWIATWRAKGANIHSVLYVDKSIHSSGKTSYGIPIGWRKAPGRC